MTFSLTGQLIDLIEESITPSKVTVEEGRIKAIEPCPNADQVYILPGFVDSHIHIESSLLAPAEFGRLAAKHGTVATVSDPHEIANVLGIEGVRFMLEDARRSPLKTAFGAPSCVPATTFETAGATLSEKEIAELFDKDHLTYLSEMMNYPGAIARDPEVMAKIQRAKERGLPVDGHAPGLRGKDLLHYVDAGISTDHECFTLPEALEKASLGMKILIREGSAARNFEALHPLLKTHPKQCMFCSDDLHPDLLIKGHIDVLVRRALSLGYDLFDVLRAASLNPVKHYKLPVGLLQVGDPADFIVVDNLKTMHLLKTYIHGVDVTMLPPQKPAKTPNRFHAPKIANLDIEVPGKSAKVIVALDGELITEAKEVPYPFQEEDILKLVVVNRYKEAPPAIAFIQGFGLKRGALASSVAHDSHNLIAVGCSDEEILRALSALIAEKGGLAVADGEKVEVLPLPIAGLMSPESGEKVAARYAELDAAAKKLGSPLRAPFMTLSFMALLVIPKLKLSDKGLFDGVAFKFCEGRGR